MNFIKKFKLDILFISAVFVGLGVLMILSPNKLPMIICCVIAGVAIAVGLCFVFDYIRKDASSDEMRYVLAIAMTAVLVGVLLFARRNDVIGGHYLLMALSFLILFSGAVKFQNSWDMKRLKYNRWFVHMVIALIGIACGFILMTGKIFTDESTRSTVIGVGLIYSGFFDLVSAFVLGGKRKVVEKRREQVDASDEEERPVSSED